MNRVGLLGQGGHFLVHSLPHSLPHTAAAAAALLWIHVLLWCLRNIPCLSWPEFGMQVIDLNLFSELTARFAHMSGDHQKYNKAE